MLSNRSLRKGTQRSYWCTVAAFEFFFSNKKINQHRSERLIYTITTQQRRTMFQMPVVKSFSSRKQARQPKMKKENPNGECKSKPKQSAMGLGSGRYASLTKS